jgi:hypothetical protein
MSVTLTRGGVQATIKDPDGKGGLAIALSQPKGSTARWKFSVRGQTDEGVFPVGEFITCPPGRNRSRIVAIANCPGVTNWTCFITLADGETDESEVSLAVGYMTSGPGVIRIGERYKEYQAAAPNAVPILAGETVLGWTAFAGAGGGFVTIEGFAAIPVPPNGSMSGSGGGLIEGPTTITTSGDIDGYLIEIAESA